MVSLNINNKGILGGGQTHYTDLTKVNSNYFDTGSAITWTVINRICYFNAYFIMKQTANDYQLPSPTMPTPLITFHNHFSCGPSQNRGMVYISSNKIRLWNYLIGGSYFFGSYPVSDSWQET